jgi:hypothetical protein
MTKSPMPGHMGIRPDRDRGFYGIRPKTGSYVKPTPKKERTEQVHQGPERTPFSIENMGARKGNDGHKPAVRGQ